VLVQRHINAGGDTGCHIDIPLPLHTFAGYGKLRRKSRQLV
jgi:hypothetical protein